MTKPRLLSFVSLAGSLAALSLTGGCKGHHDALAPDGGAGGATSSSKSSSTKSSATSGTGGSTPIVEPEVPTRFTFVNGVVDAPAIRFCFAPYPAGALDRAPFPAAGLGFAQAWYAPQGTADIPTTDALILVVVGEPQGATCADLTADPSSFPNITLLEMGVVPATALTMKRSFLVAAHGCVGGVTHTDMNEKLICGAAYTPTSPTPGLVFLPMSLLDDEENVGMQYVNAVAGMPKANVWVEPGFDGVAPIVLAASAPFGGATPNPPNLKIQVSEIGATSEAAIGTAVNPSPSPTSSVPLMTALDASGLTTAAVSNGSSIVFVGVGAAPATLPAPAPDGWWKAYTVVAVDPTKVVTQ